MADLVTRILLDNKNFDDNILKSKQQLQTFNEMTSSVKDVVGKFAIGIGIAGGAMETFNKFIEAGQGTADNWSFAIGTAKDTVDLFFTSINTGDFTAFNRGILSTIKNLHELQRVRDDLADTKNSTNVMRSQYSYQSQELKAIINDPKSTKQQVAIAKKQLLNITKDFSKQLEEQNNINTDELKKNASAKTGRYYTQNDIKNFATVYNNPASQDPRKKKFDSFNEKMSELESKLYTTTTTFTNYGAVATKGKDAKIEKQINALKKQNNELDRMRVLSKQGDKQWNEYYNSLNEYYSTKSEAAQNLNFAIKQENKANKRINGKSSSGSNKKDEIIYKEGSIGYLDKQITEYKKKLEQATTDASRQGFAKVIKELEDEKITLQFVAKYGDIKDVKDQKINGAINSKSSGFDVSQYNKIDTTKFKPIIKKEDIDNTKEYMDNLVGMSQILTNITRNTDKSAASWISWGANTLAAMATVIPQVLTLIGLKKVDAAVSKEGAVANAAKSAAETPVVGWILAISAVAALTASMLSIPKFESGGIVPGLSTTGDKVLARVNSGEMILNKKQQTHLFNILNNGVSSNNSNISSSEIQLKVKGTDLVGVLNNYNNKYNKLR